MSGRRVLIPGDKGTAKALVEIGKNVSHAQHRALHQARAVLLVSFILLVVIGDLAIGTAIQAAACLECLPSPPANHLELHAAFPHWNERLTLGVGTESRGFAEMLLSR